MISLLVAGLLLITIGAGGNMARADDGGCACGGGCGRGLFSHAEFVPNVTYYAPVPYWFPNYFNVPPYTDYQVVQYVTPPAETALIVRERILAINAANPALLTMPKEPLPFPKAHTPAKP
jgi:hypothetical protein